MMLLSPIWRHKLIMRKDSVTVTDFWVGTKLFLKTNKFLFKPLIWFDKLCKKTLKKSAKISKKHKESTKRMQHDGFLPFFSTFKFLLPIITVRYKEVFIRQCLALIQLQAFSFALSYRLNMAGYKLFCKILYKNSILKQKFSERTMLQKMLQSVPCIC